jgi:hypothetical protein
MTMVAIDPDFARLAEQFNMQIQLHPATTMSHVRWHNEEPLDHREMPPGSSSSNRPSSEILGTKEDAWGKFAIKSPLAAWSEQAYLTPRQQFFMGILASSPDMCSI